MLYKVFVRANGHLLGRVEANGVIHALSEASRTLDNGLWKPEELRLEEVVVPNVGDRVRWVTGRSRHQTYFDHGRVLAVGLTEAAVHIPVSQYVGQNADGESINIDASQILWLDLDELEVES